MRGDASPNKGRHSFLRMHFLRSAEVTMSIETWGPQIVYWVTGRSTQSGLGMGSALRSLRLKLICKKWTKRHGWVSCSGLTFRTVSWFHLASFTTGMLVVKLLTATGPERAKDPNYTGLPNVTTVPFSP